jgi:hypothetical protein
MKEALLNRPWLLILAGYLFAMSAWVTMVVIAFQHRDPPVPVPTAAHR